MKNTPTSVASPTAQQALDLQLIEALENSLEEARDESGLAEMVAGLLEQGADVNTRASDDATALMIAAYNGHIGIVSALLSRDGIDVNATASDGSTALMIAAEYGRTEIVSALLSHDGIDVNAKTSAETSSGYTALILAVKNGHIEIVSALLSRDGIDVNAETSRGYTALIIAAQKGRTEIVSALLSRDGIDVNAKTSRGYTALILAAEYGHTEIVSTLIFSTFLLPLDGGIDVNAETYDGLTALMLAAWNGHTEIVSALLSSGGIDVNAATSHGYTALMIAAECGQAKTVLALLSHDDVNWKEVRNQLSHTALQNLNEEVSVLLAVILPKRELRNLITTEEASSFILPVIIPDDELKGEIRNLITTEEAPSFILPVILPDDELRNSIITSFNKRNPRNAINQENNDILGSGLEMYKTLKDLESWHKRYLTDPDSGLGHSENEAEISANQRFFNLLNHQEARQEAFARNDLIADLVSKSASLSADFVEGAKVKDQKALDALKGLSPEDLYKLIAKITDNSRAASEKDGTDKAYASPATTMHRGSIEPIVTTPQKGGR